MEPKLFRQAGCGCTYIQLSEDTNITVEYCGDCENPLYFGAQNNIRPENLTDKFLSAEGHARIFMEINRLIALGHRFEDVQRALGIKEDRYADIT
jgi:hypothetical protein